MYFTHDMIEELQVLNGPPCILSGYLLIIINNVITRSGIDQATMGIQDKKKRTFTNLNELHNEKATEGMFKDTGITALYLYQDPQAALKNKMGNLDEEDLQKAYARAQGKYDEAVTICK